MNEVKFVPETVAADVYHLLEQAMSRYEKNDQAIMRYDSELTDLNHLIELTTYNAAEGYQLTNRVKRNRQARRKCKDENQVMKPLFELLKRDGGSLLRELRKVAQESSKQAKHLKERQYHPRTGIVTKDEFERKRVQA